MPRPDRVLGSIALGCALLVGAADVAAQRPVHSGPPNAQRVSPKITAEQRLRVDARIAAASAIVNRLQAEALALGRAPSWREVTYQSLLALPLHRLRRVDEQATSVDALAAALAEPVTDPPSLGSDIDDLVYKPIVPCRYIDTRNVAGKITGGVARGYDIGNNGSVYGGQAACAPNTMFGPAQDDIAALAMNVGITEPNGAPGFLAVKPTLAAPTTSFMNWYEAGSHVQLANAGLVTLDQDVANPNEFYIQTSETTHVTVDLFGAFIANLATPLQVIFQWGPSVNIANGQWGEAISAACPAAYTVTGGGCEGAALLDVAYSSIRLATGNQWHCYADNFTGGPTTLRALAICARVPGR